MLAEDREHHVFKLVFIILFWIFLRISIVVSGIIALIQWVLLWFQDKPIEQLLKFSTQLSIFQGQITRYITFQSDEKVFPFTDWPDVPENESSEESDSEK